MGIISYGHFKERIVRMNKPCTLCRRFPAFCAMLEKPQRYSVGRFSRRTKPDDSVYYTELHLHALTKTSIVFGNISVVGAETHLLLVFSSYNPWTENTSCSSHSLHPQPSAFLLVRNRPWVPTSVVVWLSPSLFTCVSISMATALAYSICGQTWRSAGSKRRLLQELFPTKTLDIISSCSRYIQSFVATVCVSLIEWIDQNWKH